MLLLAGGVVFGLSYVTLQARAETLGKEIRTLELRRDQLRDRIVKEQCAWARMQSPASIEQALRDQGLVMTWPNRDQIVRIGSDGSVDGSAGPEARPATRYARADRVVLND